MGHGAAPKDGHLPPPAARFDAPADEIRASILKHRGNMVRVGRDFGVQTQTLRRWLDDHPDVAGTLTTARLEAPPINSFDPDEEEVIGLIHSLNGNIAGVCRQMHCSRATMQYYTDRHPNVQVALYEAREEMLDMAEHSLYQAVLAREAWGVCFFLKTQGRKRGYIERGETFNLNVNLDKCSIEQLERIAAGEHPSLVLGAATSQSGARGQTIDALAIEGASDPGTEEEGAG
jgi:hypothetical protein